MRGTMRRIPLSILSIFFISLSCTSPTVEQEETGTREDRAALFDYLVKTTSERESFSPVKNEALGLDPDPGDGALTARRSSPPRPMKRFTTPSSRPATRERTATSPLIWSRED